MYYGGPVAGLLMIAFVILVAVQTVIAVVEAVF